MNKKTMELFQDALTAIFFAALFPFAFGLLLKLLTERV